MLLLFFLPLLIYVPLFFFINVFIYFLWGFLNTVFYTSQNIMIIFKFSLWKYVLPFIVYLSGNQYSSTCSGTLVWKVTSSIYLFKCVQVYTCECFHFSFLCIPFSVWWFDFCCSLKNECTGILAWQCKWLRKLWVLIPLEQRLLESSFSGKENTINTQVSL